MLEDESCEFLSPVSSQCGETASFGASLRSAVTLGWRAFASSRLKYAYDTPSLASSRWLSPFRSQLPILNTRSASPTAQPEPGNRALRVRRRLSGTQIHPSCCSGVFVDESAESVAPMRSVWRA